jgi:hypothetical protein
MATRMTDEEARREGRGYALAFASDDGVLRVKVSGGEDAQAVRIAYWREIVAEGLKRQMRLLLVTDRKKGTPATPAELADLASLMAGFAPNFDKVAVVEPTAEFFSAVQHGEILGQEVGINVRVFSEVALAEQWLRFGSQEF